MNSEQNFISYRPKEQRLHSYIAYYYFHFSNEIGLKSNFIYYPNTKNAITIYKDSKLFFDQNFSSSKPCTESCLSINFSGIQTSARMAEIVTPFNKIGIVFHPLGINHFVNQPLVNVISNNNDKTFYGFGDNFDKTCKRAFEEDDVQKKVEILDDYFINHFLGFKEHKLIQATEIIGNSDSKINVEALAKTVAISRRALLRYFKAHLCCTIQQYCHVVQFRKSISNYIESEGKHQRLTNLAYKYGYYDQSDFIKNMHKLTGESPNSFFNNVTSLGKEETFWKIE